jgi:amino acid transporter
LKQVNRYTKTPVNAVWFVTTIGALLGLLMFASPIAIGAVFSIAAIAQYTAFIIPIAIKLFVVGDKFRPGEFVAPSIQLHFLAFSSFHWILVGGEERSLERKKQCSYQLFSFRVANPPP